MGLKPPKSSLHFFSYVKDDFSGSLKGLPESRKSRTFCKHTTQAGYTC